METIPKCATLGEVPFNHQNLFGVKEKNIFLKIKIQESIQSTMN